MAGNEKLRILTISLEGLQNTMTEMIENILVFLNDYDVIMLQETHVGHDSHPLFTGILELSHTIRNDELQIEGNTEITTANFRFHRDIKFYLTHSWSNKSGVGIIINTNHKVRQKFYNNGTYIGVCANIGGREYTFVSVYFKSTDNGNFLQQCSQDIEDYRQGSILVIGGDFNVTLTTLDVKEDKNHRYARRRMFNDWNYSDVWRLRHPNKREYTFRSHKLTTSGEKQEARLDYFFMRNCQINLVENCTIHGDISKFQHKPVSLTISHTEPNGLGSSNPHDPHPPESASSQPSHPDPRQETETKPEPESNYEYESNLDQATEAVGGLNITDDSK